jgi:hypothetical protein
MNKGLVVFIALASACYSAEGVRSNDGGAPVAGWAKVAARACREHRQPEARVPKEAQAGREASRVAVARADPLE